MVGFSSARYVIRQPGCYGRYYYPGTVETPAPFTIIRQTAVEPVTRAPHIIGPAESYSRAINATGKRIIFRKRYNRKRRFYLRHNNYNIHCGNLPELLFAIVNNRQSVCTNRAKGVGLLIRLLTTNANITDNVKFTK